MILAFEFKMAYESEDFIFLLSRLSQNLENKIEVKENFITLFINSNEDELKQFADNLSQNLASSIYLKGFRVYEVENFNEINSYKAKNTQSDKITPSTVNKYLKEGKIIRNEFGILSNFTDKNEEEFEDFVNKSVNIFLEKGKIEFDEFSINTLDENLDFDYIMATNFKNLNKIFVSNEKTQIALASFEKPCIELKTSSIFRQKHPNSKKFYKVVAPFDMFFYAFCEKIFKKGINFISLKGSLKSIKVLMLDDTYLVSGKNFRNFDEFKGSYLKFGLSNDNISFINNKDKIPLLFIPKFRSFSEIYDEIKKIENGEKFLENFSKQYPLVEGEIEFSGSFFSLFCIIGKILNFDSDFTKAGEKLLLNANDFSVKKGVSIDSKKEENKFNAIKYIKSAMAFHLAGAGIYNISFGCIESLALFFSDFVYEFSNELKFENVLFGGKLFENQTVSNLFFKHIKPNFNIEFENFVVV